MIPKFRAWSKRENRMFLVGEIDFQTNEIRENITRFGHELNEIVLMQSTGRIDKNGKEIFEGDILAINDNDYSCKCVISKSIWRSSYWLQKISGRYNEDFEYAPLYLEKCEVIGNIYEDPNLLKKRK